MNEEYDEDFIVILTAVVSASYCQIELDQSFEKINVNSRAIFLCYYRKMELRVKATDCWHKNRGTPSEI